MNQQTAEGRILKDPSKMSERELRLAVRSMRSALTTIERSTSSRPPLVEQALLSPKQRIRAIHTIARDSLQEQRA